MNDIKHCIHCKKKVVGRADKKFCDDNCRNAYNNMLNSDENNFVRNINNMLRKNRRILKQMLGTKEDTIKVSKLKLANEGFSFHYFTHLYQTQKQQTYFFVYEYGYLPLADDQILIVKRSQ